MHWLVCRRSRSTSPDLGIKAFVAGRHRGEPFASRSIGLGAARCTVIVVELKTTGCGRQS